MAGTAWALSCPLSLSHAAAGRVSETETESKRGREKERERERESELFSSLQLPLSPSEKTNVVFESLIAHVIEFNTPFLEEKKSL